MDTDTGNVTFTALDLVELGLTYRQVHYWYRKGYITPENPYCGSGTDVLTFSTEQATLAIRMQRLASAGIPPKVALQAIKNNGDVGHGIRITIDGSSPGESPL